MRPYGLAWGKYILYLLYVANTLMSSGRWYTFPLAFWLALARPKYIHMGHVGATTPWKPKSKSRINWTKFQHVEHINFLYKPNTTNQSRTYESERENLIEGGRRGWRSHEAREMNEWTKSACSRLHVCACSLDTCLFAANLIDHTHTATLKASHNLRWEIEHQHEQTRTTTARKTNSGKVFFPDKRETFTV